MGSEENVALFRRFVDELINNRNVAVIDTMVAEDFVEHDGLPGFPAGRDGLKQLFAAVLGGFPDLRAQVEDSMAQGDKVMLRMTYKYNAAGLGVNRYNCALFSEEVLGAAGVQRSAGLVVSTPYEVATGQKAPRNPVSQLLLNMKERRARRQAAQELLQQQHIAPPPVRRVLTRRSRLTVPAESLLCAGSVGVGY